MLNFEQIIESVQSSIMEVGEYQIIQQNSLLGLEIEDKGLNQLVSKVDVTSEKMLVNACTKAIPKATFITEENTINQSKDSEYCWIIDPLDGTTNFLHGLEVFSISVALFKNGEPELAWVHCPKMNQTFFAQKGKGAFLNKSKISVSKIATLEKSLLATGFPYYTFEEMQPYLNLLEEFMKGTHGLRRMGSAAIDLAYVACGKFEGFFELNLSPWDVAAGALLVTEAGGIMCDFKGGNDFVFGNSILASNFTIHPEFMETIQKHF